LGVTGSTAHSRWRRQSEAQSHESHRLAPSPSLNPAQPLTHESHLHCAGTASQNIRTVIYRFSDYHILPNRAIQRSSIAGQHLDREPSYSDEFLRLSPIKIKLGSLTTAEPQLDIDARRLTGGTVSSRAAGLSAPSFIASSSVTPCATKHEGTPRLLSVTGIISPFTVTTS
jgi:hypothetical protein